MRFCILTYGSRGDIQPYLALGLGLRRAGHSVRLAAPGLYEAFVRSYGLDYARLPGDPAGLMRRVFARQGLLGPISTAQAVLRAVAPVAVELYPAVQAACQGADAVVHSLLLTGLGHQAALELGVLDVSALVFALFSPTTAFPNPLFPAWSWGERYNYLSHREFNRVFWYAHRLGLAWLRRREAAVPRLAEWPFWRSDPYLRPPRPSRWETPILYGLSPSVLPRPADWDANVHLTGYWFLPPPEDWQPSEELRRFLEAGPPPVYLGFGSVISRRVQRLTRRALQALTHLSQRVILVAGWGGFSPAELPPGVLALQGAPFHWLFPRLAGVIHHGGMGTTAAAFRAGIPQLIVPFGADQPFWGRRAAALHTGLTLSARAARGQRLETALERVLNEDCLRDSARRLGQRVRGEDGVGVAVRLLEGLPAHYQQPTNSSPERDQHVY